MKTTFIACLLGMLVLCAPAYAAERGAATTGAALQNGTGAAPAPSARNAIAPAATTGTGSTSTGAPGSVHVPKLGTPGQQHDCPEGQHWWIDKCTSGGLPKAPSFGLGGGTPVDTGAGNSTPVTCAPGQWKVNGMCLDKGNCPDGQLMWQGKCETVPAGSTVEPPQQQSGQQQGNSGQPAGNDNNKTPACGLGQKPGLQGLCASEPNAKGKCEGGLKKASDGKCYSNADFKKIQ